MIDLHHNYHQKDEGISQSSLDCALALVHPYREEEIGLFPIADPI